MGENRIALNSEGNNGSSVLNLRCCVGENGGEIAPQRSYEDGGE
jgi:hypothetical protein